MKRAHHGSQHFRIHKFVTSTASDFFTLNESWWVCRLSVDFRISQAWWRWAWSQNLIPYGTSKIKSPNRLSHPNMYPNMYKFDNNSDLIHYKHFKIPRNHHFWRGPWSTGRGSVNTLMVDRLWTIAYGLSFKLG